MLYGLRADFKPKRPGGERLQFLGETGALAVSGAGMCPWHHRVGGGDSQEF